VPIPLFRYRIRKTRVLGPLVQSVPRIVVDYRRWIGDGYDPGWPSINGQTQAPIKKIGSQVTDSEEHPQWSKRRNKASKDLADIGGDFYSQSQYAVGKPANISVRTPKVDVGSGMYKIITITGPAWAIDARAYSFPPSESSTDAQIDALGATAIAKCKPTRSQADIGVAIGELVREGIPKLAVSQWKTRARNLKAGKEVSPEGAVADNYLAYQFGLAPLGQEIGNFAAQVIRADQLLAQYERDAGRVVRRRFEFPTKHETSQATVAASDSPWIGSPQAGSLNPALTPSQRGEVIRVREITQKRWFSGAFTYYLPSWYDARNEMSRKALLAKEVLGVDLDPEVIWNLTPWSWAVDWFSNAGDIVSNAASMLEDGLIMRYGYMMEHTIVKDTYTRAYGNVFLGSGGFDSSVTLVTETKIRRRANPFGFGLTWDGLSTFQKSILAALGISRTR
jgi:hypothetical protein